MKLAPIQQSFASGELSERLVGQISSPIRQTGVAKLENMIVYSQGPVSSRGGSFVLDTAENNDNIRMVPFNVSRGKDYAIALTPGVLRIYDVAGRVDTGTNNLIQDGYFQQGGTFWDVVVSGSATVVFKPESSSCELNAGTGNQDAAINQSLIPMETAEINNNHTITGLSTGAGTLHINLGTSLGANDILNQNIPNGSFSITFVPTTEQLYLEFINQSNSTTAIVATLGLNRDGVAIELSTPYLASDLPEIQYQMISAQEEIIIVHNNHHPKLLKHEADNTWSFGDVPFVYDEAAPPGTPIWPVGDYPGVITIHQGRLWLARSRTQRQTFWASRSGAYFDFYAASTPADDDFFTRDLATPGDIEWIKGQKVLVFGTDLSESVITSSGGVITQSDIDIKTVSVYGSATLGMSKKIEDQIVYVSPDSRKVRAITFRRESEWFSPDITWRAEHITKENRITELHFIRDPDPLLLAITKSGVSLSCAYERNEEVIGWARHFNSNLDFKSAAVVNGNLGSVSFVAEKLSTGVMVISVILSSSLNPTYMDAAHVLVPIDDGTNIYVDGLNHLEGLLASVKIDGAIHPSQIVGAAGPEGETDQPATPGRIYLQYLGNLAVVGLGFVAKVIPMPMDVGSPAGSGSGFIKHWNKVIVRVRESAKMLINGHRQPEREPATPMNTVQPILTEDIVVPTLGHDRFAQIVIEQDLPLRMEVLAILGEMSQERL